MLYGWGKDEEVRKTHYAIACGDIPDAEVGVEHFWLTGQGKGGKSLSEIARGKNIWSYETSFAG